MCPVTVLVLRSPERPIKCSRRRFIPHILRWDGHPTAGASPQNLGGITPTQFASYIRRLEELFPHFTNFQALQIYKLTNLQDFLIF